MDPLTWAMIAAGVGLMKSIGEQNTPVYTDAQIADQELSGYRGGKSMPDPYEQPDPLANILQGGMMGASMVQGMGSDKTPTTGAEGSNLTSASPTPSPTTGNNVGLGLSGGYGAGTTSNGEWFEHAKASGNVQSAVPMVAQSQDNTPQYSDWVFGIEN